MTNAIHTPVLISNALYFTASVLLAAAVEAQENIESEDEEGEIEVIIVTGSRIPQDEFSSPSPLQVIDIKTERQIGVSSVTEMLHRATVTNGTQIDASFNTGILGAGGGATAEPPPGGIGSANISLRGLGPERTLVLMNGRRLGSVGVRGAPIQPDIALIPFTLVDRVEILTEGVSAVYGADAVAGVVNVILRDEFDGFEVMANSQSPSDSGGQLNQISLLAGARSDRSSFQFAVEFMDRERVAVGSRDWAHCLRDIDQLEDGSIQSICRSGFFDNVALHPPFNFRFFTAGQSDIGVPDWSSSNVLPPPDHPLLNDPGEFGRFAYIDLYNDQDERRAADLVAGMQRYSLVSTGKILMDWWSNEEIYFEGMYLNSQVLSQAVNEQFFPELLGQIPQEDADGNIVVDPAGVPILVDNPLNPFPFDVQPIFTLDSVPQHRDVEREQSRFVLGMRGDVGNSSWIWDAFFSYDRGIGFQSQAILFEPHLQVSVRNLRLDANGDVTCALSDEIVEIAFSFFTTADCVPLDFTNPNLYIGGPTGEGTLT